MNSLLQERSCPSCGAAPDASRPEVISRNPAESLSEEALAQYFFGIRADQCFFTYFRCPCGLLWNPVYFSHDALNELYSAMPDNTRVMGEFGSERTQHGYAQTIAQLSHHGGTYLELGADIGLLVRSVSQLIDPEVIVAVEPNESVQIQLNDALGAGGIVVATILDVPYSVTATTAAAIHVVDHLLTPRETVGELASIIAKRGRLFVVVHNEKSLLRRLLGTKWPPFCLQHPQLFTPRTLQTLMEASGFKTLATRRTSNWLSIRQAGALGASVGLAPKTAVNLLPSTAISLKLGNFCLISERV